MRSDVGLQDLTPDAAKILLVGGSNGFCCGIPNVVTVHEE
jgi:hypothetical protein